MELHDFLRKYNIKLDEKEMALCNKALDIMKTSVDESHDYLHIKRLLTELDRFLSNSNEININEIDFRVLVLALCWHDTWRSQRFPYNKLAFIFNQIWDGMGSKNLFKKYASLYKLDPESTKKIAYLIRKHSDYQFKKADILESKILNDLDSLEVWSHERLDLLKEKYLMIEEDQINPTNLKIALFYFEKVMKKRDDSKFNFDWFKLEFKKRHLDYILRVEKAVEEYGHYIGRVKKS